MIMTVLQILALCSLISPIVAQSNGMVMSMDVPMDLAVGNMLPYAHFTPGDTVWFLGWVPSSVGAMVGTCIALLLLSILERWVAACLAFAEHHWAESASALAPENPLPSTFSPSPSLSSKRPRIPPFVPEFDITRGVLFAAHSFLRIFLMMAVMTFQLAFLLSIAVGSGVGETLFGRFSPSEHGHW